MGYTLYFKTGNNRCTEVYRLNHRIEDGPACFLPQGHYGPHIAWDSADTTTRIWWVVKDDKPVTLEEALKGKINGLRLQ